MTISSAVFPALAIAYAPHWLMPTPWPYPLPLIFTRPSSTRRLSSRQERILVEPMAIRNAGAETSCPEISSVSARPDSPRLPTAMLSSASTFAPEAFAAAITSSAEKSACQCAASAGASSFSMPLTHWV